MLGIFLTLHKLRNLCNGYTPQKLGFWEFWEQYTMGFRATHSE